MTMTGSSDETTGEKSEDVDAGLAPVTITKSALITRGKESKGLDDDFGNATVSDSTIEDDEEASTGLIVELASLTVRGSRLTQRMGNDASAENEDGHLTLEHDTVEVDGAGEAVEAEGAMLTLTSDNFAVNAPSDAEAVIDELGPGATLRNVNVHGTWIGPALEGLVSHSASIIDSTLNDGADTGAPVVVFESLASEGLPFLVQRSRIIGGATAASAMEVEGSGSIALDSSLLQGGVSGLTFTDEGAKKQQVVVAASTIDAGTAGVSNEPGVASIATDLLGPSRTLNVDVEGSVLFEPMTGMLLSGASGLTMSCQNSDAPSQSQAASAAVGAINCRSGAHGNDNLPSLGSIFASPITKYELKKHTKAINSVPSDTVTLPLGMKPAPFDLGAHKRALYEREGRKCELVQDRGALQIPGQKPDCKPKRKRRR